ncbi:MAG TPA: PD-(D/E)XK nuclease family protein, partial [Anaeromyxobacter sp.]|nr:PD-(D/E)XK nuclease family protein [Anaeromyxobacter sp.]
MRCIVLDSPAISSWANAVAALPARAPLPARTVLVPSERHAHALRRALASSGRAAVLAGTRFVGPLTAAIEVLRRAGVAFSPGEDALRPARLLALFREDLGLEHFDAELLRTARGWDRAFASAIEELEAAGLSPADLPADAAPSRDLAKLWTRATAAAGTSLGAARVHLEAAAVLAREPGAWPFHGPAIAMATGHEDVAVARFLAAIPDVTIALRVVPPVRARLLERLGRLFGAEARSAVEASREAPTGPEARTERDLLAAHLFADPKVLADPARPRSAGADGTVDLEEHAGIEAELEATATWVSRQVLERRRPLEDVAVLVPARDPLAQLVADRLERLPFEGGPLPVHVAGGVPAVATAAGARVLAVLRALAAGLSAETLAPLVPALRIAEPGTGEPGHRTHLSHGDAIDVAYGLGTVGGNAARPEGALDWAARASARIAELEADLAHARGGGDSGARDAARIERQLENLRALQPALAMLAGVAFSVVGDAPLALLWTELHSFLRRCLLAPGDGGAIVARLAESLAPACAGPLGKALTGADALAAVEDRLRALRVPRGRFGAPAVYVGTVGGAAGLDFGAVRVVGLCEGALPSATVEDPVLPERARVALERAAPGRVLPLAEDRVAAQLDALASAIRGAREAVALSAPRVDLSRTEREPAALFVDAAAALARPDAATGERADAVPGMAALRRDHFRPSAAAAAAFGGARPVSEASWLERVARVAADLPPRWVRDPVLDLGRVAALCAATGRLGPADGVLGPGEPFPPVPGLDPACPISASGLKDLFTCPRMFLMKRILGWQEAAGAP